MSQTMRERKQLRLRRQCSQLRLAAWRADQLARLTAAILAALALLIVLVLAVATQFYVANKDRTTAPLPRTGACERTA